MSPLILSSDVHSSVFSRNSRIGFMRMNQYHFLKLVQHVLESERCSEMKLTFHCVDADDDLHEAEFQSRVKGITEKVQVEGRYSGTSAEAMSILNRFEYLPNCFGDGRLAVPARCGEEFTFSSSLRIAQHCLDWMRKIESRPTMNWSTPDSLPPSSQERYPETGTLY